MSGKTIISIISTNLGPFGASHVASDGIFQFSKNRIIFLEIRDLENLLFSTAYLRPTIYSFLKHSFLQVDPVAEWLRALRALRIILIPWIERNEGSGPIYPISFLSFSKMFFRISMDAIYNCNSLDLHSVIHLLLIINTYHH